MMNESRKAKTTTDRTDRLALAVIVVAVIMMIMSVVGMCTAADAGKEGALDLDNAKAQAVHRCTHWLFLAANGSLRTGTVTTMATQDGRRGDIAAYAVTVFVPYDKPNPRLHPVERAVLMRVDDGSVRGRETYSDGKVASCTARLQDGYWRLESLWLKDVVSIKPVSAEDLSTLR